MKQFDGYLCMCRTAGWVSVEQFDRCLCKYGTAGWVLAYVWRCRMGVSVFVEMLGGYHFQ